MSLSSDLVPGRSELLGTSRKNSEKNNGNCSNGVPCLGLLGCGGVCKGGCSLLECLTRMTVARDRSSSVVHFAKTLVNNQLLSTGDLLTSVGFLPCGLGKLKLCFELGIQTNLLNSKGKGVENADFLPVRYHNNKPVEISFGNGLWIC